jgi:phosphosulfolactate synthase
MSDKAWEGAFSVPCAGRSVKPRRTGLTMVIDKGLGEHVLGDLIATAGDYIDVIKLAFGTSAFYGGEALRKKTGLINAAGIDVMPGGTFLEVSVWQKTLPVYLEKAVQLGFTAIEVSDGTIEMDRATRREAIRRASGLGFKVITEVGKKDPAEAPSIEAVHELIREDLGNGAFKVIIEAREAGRGVGIFDGAGRTKAEEIERILAGGAEVDDLVWEAPLKNQQQDLILRFGINVNLGNIPPEEVLALEALRQGCAATFSSGLSRWALVFFFEQLHEDGVPFGISSFWIPKKRSQPTVQEHLVFPLEESNLTSFLQGLESKETPFGIEEMPEDRASIDPYDFVFFFELRRRAGHLVHSGGPGSRSGPAFLFPPGPGCRKRKPS